MTQNSLGGRLLAVAWRLTTGAFFLTVMAGIQSQLSQVSLSWREVILIVGIPILLYVVGYLIEYTLKGVVERYLESNSTRPRRSERREL